MYVIQFFAAGVVHSSASFLPLIWLPPGNVDVMQVFNVLRSKKKRFKVQKVFYGITKTKNKMYFMHIYICIWKRVLFLSKLGRILRKKYVTKHW